MANKILIQLNTANATIAGSAFSDVIEAPLLTDISPEFQTTHFIANDCFGSAGEAISNITKLYSALSGKISESWLKTANTFNLPIWQKTDPARLTITLGFFLKDDPEKDIMVPVRKLIGQSILSRDFWNPEMLIVPGISLNTIKDVKNPTKTNSTAKIVSVWIPGVMYIAKAIILNAKPTFSRQRVDAGFFAKSSYYPLWASVDLTIEGLIPAIMEDIFDNEFEAYNNIGVLKQF